MKSIHFKKKKSVIENRTWELYFLGQITSIHNGQFRANILMKFRANMGIVKCADMPENLKKWHCPSSPVELGKHPWNICKKFKFWSKTNIIHKHGSTIKWYCFRYRTILTKRKMLERGNLYKTRFITLS